MSTPSGRGTTHNPTRLMNYLLAYHDHIISQATITPFKNKNNFRKDEAPQSYSRFDLLSSAVKTPCSPDGLFLVRTLTYDQMSVVV